MKKAISWILSISMFVGIASIPALADNEMKPETNMDTMLEECVGDSQAVQMRKTVASDVENLDSIGITPDTISSMRLEDNGKIAYIANLVPGVSTEFIVAEEANGNLTLDITEGDKHDTILFRNDGKLYLNGYEVVAKTRNEEVGNQVSANSRSITYSQTCPYGNPTDYYTKPSFYAERDVELNQRWTDVGVAALSIILGGILGTVMVGITSSVLITLAQELNIFAEQYNPTSTCGSYSVYSYQHPDSTVTNTYTKYYGTFYVFKNFDGNGTPYQYYCENYFN